MCGIWGALGHFEDGALGCLHEWLRHRGPDAEGVVELKLTGAGRPLILGHRRLAVLDLSPRANQPMYSADGRFVVVLNGEIYNFRELAARHHIKTRTSSDTEVLVELWRIRGPECVRDLDGIFAFAIADLNAGETYLCRDPIGVKPLYYWTGGDGRIAFASEMTALIALVPEVDIRPQGVADYLHHRFVPGPRTMLEGVFKVRPGEVLRIGEREPRLLFGAPWAEERSEMSHEEAREVLQRTVRMQMVADVPVGVFLSGGLDSSLIAALAAQETEGLSSFSISFDDKLADESSFAANVADFLGTRHHNIRFRGSLVEQIPSIVRVMDEPLADPAILPFFELSRYARERVVVALSGDGADELFGGYRHYLFRQWESYLGGFRRVSGWLAALGQRSARLRRASAALGSDLTTGWSEWTGAFTMAEVRSLTGLLPTRLADSIESLEDGLSTDMRVSLVDRMLMKVDKASMAASLEVRVPFLGRDVVDLARRLPLRQKVGVRNRKVILKRIARELLPAWVWQRPKHGFNLPLSRWLSEGRDYNYAMDTLGDGLALSQWVEPAAIHPLVRAARSRKADVGLELFALLVLHEWHSHVRRRREEAFQAPLAISVPGRERS